MAGGDEELRRQVGDAQVVREAFEELPLATCVLDGPEHRFVAANAAYRAMVGRSALLGRRMRDVLPDSAGQRHYEVIERVYTTGEPYTVHEWRIQVVTADGEPVELYVNSTVTPRFGPDGAVRGVTAQTTDVTAQVLERRATRTATTAAEQRHRQAGEVLAALQTALLPASLPVLPNARIGASYLLADTDTAAGGDWFDAAPLPDGRVALVVGDVVGHGITAAAVMGQLRAILSERLAAGASMVDALAAVDAVAAHLTGAQATTVCLVVLDPADGSLSYCTAGHPPPLLVPAHGEARYLPTTGAGPLGVGTRLRSGTEQLDVGDVLLLYTDGIIERPGQAVAASTVELIQVVADAVSGNGLRNGPASPVDRTCAQTLELLVRERGHTDDITLLAVQRVEPRPDLELRCPARVEAVGATRAALGDWLRDVGATGTDVLTVQHAVGELVTNAVEHAYGADAGSGSADATVILRARLSADGLVHVAVADHGHWRDGPAAAEPATSSRGRGLAMAHALLRSLHVDKRPDGTTVTGRHRLTRPAQLLTTAEIRSGTRPEPGRAAAPTLLMVLDQPVGEQAEALDRVRVDGPVDALTAPQLDVELRRRTRGGSRGLTVDLTGVTHLASAGVAVLHHAVRSSGADAPLRLYAPVDSPAAHVLDLVALAHDTDDPDT